MHISNAQKCCKNQQPWYIHKEQGLFMFYSTDDGLTKKMIIVISVLGTLLLSFPMGIFIGCCGAMCVKKYRQLKEMEVQEDCLYESADRIKSGVAMNKNNAYGIVKQRRT